MYFNQFFQRRRDRFIVLYPRQSDKRDSLNVTIFLEPERICGRHFLKINDNEVCHIIRNFSITLYRGEIKEECKMIP